MELVERLERRVHRLVPAPRLGDHHHQGVRERAPREDEQLEDVVEHRGVGALEVDRGEDLRQVVAEEARGEHPLARLHPVHVAAERVDLAVVGDVAVRVGARPAREGVRREARVDHREARGERLGGEVRVERRELVGVQHPLVDDGARREARDVEGVPPRQRRAGDRLLGEAADHEELPLERVPRLRPFPAADEELPDDGLARAGRRAERGAVGRDVAPAEEPLPLRGDDLLEPALAGLPARGLKRQEEHPEAVVAGRRQLDPGRLRPPRDEAVRDLREEPGAVAGVLLAPRRAAVLEVREDLQRLADDVVGGAGRDVDDEPEAAGVVLVPRVVEALRRRGTGDAHVRLAPPPGGSRRLPRDPRDAPRRTRWDLSIAGCYQRLPHCSET